MAQLNSRGTQTRNRWDYFERSNAFASVWGNVPSGPIGAYLANNSTGNTALDIYNLSWFSSIGITAEIDFLLPPLIVAPITPIQNYVRALQPDAATPPGVVGMFSNNAGAFATILRYSGQLPNDELTPVPGSYFITLPPGWAIAILLATQPNPVELSMTVWYQEVTDNIRPAM